MRIIVSDSCCLIDLRKASLLETFVRLPYDILIPNTLFEDELVKFTAKERSILAGGLKIMDLPGESVVRAQGVVRERPGLSIHDGFAFALAESCPDCILLSGDSGLRDLAEEQNIEVHGVLWVIEEIHENGLAEANVIVQGLHLLAADRTVRLPRGSLGSQIKRYERINDNG